MILVRLFEEWEASSNRDQWCWKNMVQSRAMKQARNIKEQLQDYMRKVEWEKLQADIEDFKGLKNRKRYGRNCPNENAILKSSKQPKTKCQSFA
jgi:hypothetical protein